MKRSRPSPEFVCGEPDPNHIRAKLDDKPVFTTDELQSHREKFAEVNRLVNAGCSQWPSSFVLSIKIEYGGGGGQTFDAVVIQWGWVSHSTYLCKMFTQEDGTFYSKRSCRFDGFDPSPHAGAVAIPRFLIETTNKSTAFDLYACLTSIARYQKTTHEEQANPDVMVIPAVPAFSRHIIKKWFNYFAEDTTTLQIALLLRAMDHFGL